MFPKKPKVFSKKPKVFPKGPKVFLERQKVFPERLKVFLMFKGVSSKTNFFSKNKNDTFFSNKIINCLMLLRQ